MPLDASSGRHVTGMVRPSQPVSGNVLNTSGTICLDFDGHGRFALGYGRFGQGVRSRSLARSLCLKFSLFPDCVFLLPFTSFPFLILSDPRDYIVKTQRKNQGEEYPDSEIRFLL